MVGGGAAGLELVTRLGDTLGRKGNAHITLIERSRTHLWKPLLHAAAAGSIDPAAHELNYLAQARWHHFHFEFGEMTGIDRARKHVVLGATRDEDGREITPRRIIPYDTLVIAIGSLTNDFGTPGVAQYAIPLETADQAQRFNRRLVNAFLRAHADGRTNTGWLRVAIVGAGATGAELAAELLRTTREMAGYGSDRHAPQQDIRVVLIEAADRVLPTLPERVSRAAEALLRGLGVDIRVGARVAEVTGDGVRLVSGDHIPAELIVWAAGVKAPEVLTILDGLATNRSNQLLVTATLQTTEDPDVFAIGDCAACPRPGYPTPVPPRAQAAHQQAIHLARQLARRLGGRPLEPFRYRDFGSLVSLGQHTAVGQLMGFLAGSSLFIEGYLARLAYQSLYLRHEASLRGAAKTVLQNIGRSLIRRTGPTVKLH